MKIPTLVAPRTNSRPLPTPYNNVRPDSGLQELGKGLSEAGGHLLEIQARADAVDVADAMTEAERGVQPLLVGGGDKDHVPLYHEAGEGLLNARGRRAAELSTPALEETDKRIKKVREGLTSDRQRGLFDRKIADYRLGVEKQVQGHVNGQLRVAEEAALQGRAANLLADISARPKVAGDTAKQAEHDLDIARRVKDVAGLARAFAIDPELGEAAARDIEKAALKARLDALLANGPHKDVALAQSLLVKNRGLLGKDGDAYQKQVMEVGADGDAQAIVWRHTNPESGLVNRTEAEAELRNIPDAERYTATAKLLDFHLARAEKAREAKVASYVAPAIQAFNRDKSFREVPFAIRNWIETHAPEDWRKLDKWRLDEEAIQRTLESAKRSELRRERSDYLREETATLRRELTEARRIEGERNKSRWDLELRIVQNSDHYRQMSPEEFARETIGLGAERLVKVQERFEANKKVDVAKRGDFDAYVKKRSEGHTSLKSKADKDAFTHRMGEAWHNWRRDRDWRYPTDAEIEKEIEPLVWTRKLKGFWFWETEVEALQEKGKVPSPGRAPRPAQTSPRAAPAPAAPAPGDAAAPGMRWQTNKRTGERRQVPR